MNFNGTITYLLNCLKDSGCPKCQQKDSFKSFIKNQITNPYFLNQNLAKVTEEGDWHFECANPNCLYKITKFDEIFRDQI
jgi:hypothetical protein